MSDEQQNANEDKDRLMPLKEAAKLYGFNTSYLGELAKKGRLKAERYGWMWLTTPANMEEYIKSRDRRGAYRDDIQVD